MRELVPRYSGPDAISLPVAHPNLRIVLRDLEVVNGYRIEGLIGSGSSSQVVAGRDPNDGKVALKLFTGEDYGPDNFSREVDIHTALQPILPNAVPLLGHGVYIPDATNGDPRIPYMVMQRADGSMQDALQRNGKLGVDQALDYVEQSAEGLGVLHEEVGLVHCDVKPSNLLLVGNNKVWISDFGGATYPDEDREFNFTPTYAAPEQVLGEISPATDQYGLAVVLFEIISGDPPFPTEDSRMYRETVTSDEYPVFLATRTVAAIPPELLSPVRRALHSNPDRRFSTVGDFAQELMDRRREVSEANGEVVVFDGSNPAPIPA